MAGGPGAQLTPNIQACRSARTSLSSSEINGVIKYLLIHKFGSGFKIYLTIVVYESQVSVKPQDQTLCGFGFICLGVAIILNCILKRISVTFENFN